MGQKVNPHGARVGVIIDWSTKWYAGKKDFSNNLIEDYNLRKMLKEKLNQAGISHIDLQRAGEKLHVIGLIIQSNLDELEKRPGLYDYALARRSFYQRTCRRSCDKRTFIRLVLKSQATHQSAAAA